MCGPFFDNCVLGQSDIKKLRRENYQLRKEIWTLRDEYDRLGKSLRNKPRSVDNFANVSHTCANSADDCKHGCECIDCCSYYLDEVSVPSSAKRF